MKKNGILTFLFAFVPGAGQNSPFFRAVYLMLE